MIQQTQLVGLRSDLTESSTTKRDRARTASKRGKAYYRKSIERIAKVRACQDIIADWKVDPNYIGWWDRSTEVWLPPPATTIDEWADRCRKIAGEFAAEPGDWHTDKIECMREVMRACSPNDPCSRIILVKSSQTSGTESAILNPIGFTIDVNPRSMLVIFPTLDLAQSFAKERLDPMLDLCPSLKDKVGDVGRSSAKDKMSSTIMKKRYPGGFLNMAGANSTSGLSSRPVPIVMMDEVDRCIQNAGREGNPTKLLATRATTFIDRKEIYISSPANPKGTSGIIQMFEDSTQEEWEVLCPNGACGCWQVLLWDRMDLETGRVHCTGCQQAFPQWEWKAATDGRWVARNPFHPNTRGFRVNGLVSPWLDWQDLCLEYKEALRVAAFGDNSLLRVFYNTRLAEAFEAVGKKVDIDLYGLRREVYECHKVGAELPDGVLVLTASIDVQDTFLAYEVVGWGKGRESWGIEVGEFQGDPAAPDQRVWKLADEYLYKRVFKYTNGDLARIKLIFADSQGHKTHDVYRYTKARHPRVISIKGVGGLGHGIIVGAKRREAGEGVWIVRLGVDTLKDELYARLEVGVKGPGYCHYPMKENGMDVCGYTKDYFDELTAEQRVISYSKGGFAKYEWTKNRTDANEALDLRNYNRAALEYLKARLDTMDREILSAKQLAEMKLVKTEVGTNKFITTDSREMREQKVIIRGNYGVTKPIQSFDASGSEEERSASTTQPTRTSYYGKRKPFGAVSTSF